MATVMTTLLTFPRTGKAESQVVVPVVRVVVAIRRLAVPGVVVPAAAPVDPARASLDLMTTDSVPRFPFHINPDSVVTGL